MIDRKELKKYCKFCLCKKCEYRKTCEQKKSFKLSNCIDYGGVGFCTNFKRKE